MKKEDKTGAHNIYYDTCSMARIGWLGRSKPHVIQLFSIKKELGCTLNEFKQRLNRETKF
jgi:hypothetical protein